MRFWILFATLFAGVGLVVIGTTEMYRGWRSKQWPIAEGTVVSSQVVKTRNSADSRTPLYGPKIEVRYTVAGQSYSCTKIWSGAVGGRESDAQRLVADYPVGKTVRVYHHPKDPGDAMLRVGVRWTSIVALIFGFVFLGLRYFGGLWWRRTLGSKQPNLGSGRC